MSIELQWWQCLAQPTIYFKDRNDEPFGKIEINQETYQSFRLENGSWINDNKFIDSWRVKDYLFDLQKNLINILEKI